MQRQSADHQMREEIKMLTGARKQAILFDVDDTLYDQTVPFKEAYAEFFGKKPAVPAGTIYPVTRKYSDQVYFQALAGHITMEEMYIYRVQKAFQEFGIRITDEDALGFQKIYAGRQRQIHMSKKMEEILEYCSGKTDLGIITNGLSEHQWNKVKSLRVERWIPHENIFVSADVGAEKPHREIFEYAEHAMGLEDAEVWFVGDAYELDIKGAVKMGWNTVWMNRRDYEKPKDHILVWEEVRTEQELMIAVKRFIDC